MAILKYDKLLNHISHFAGLSAIQCGKQLVVKIPFEVEITLTETEFCFLKILGKRYRKLNAQKTYWFPRLEYIKCYTTPPPPTTTTIIQGEDQSVRQGY